MSLEYINKLVDIDKYYLYYEYQPILSSDNLKQLRQEIKKKKSSQKRHKNVCCTFWNK